jgi:site-specific recombinase XerC
MVEPERGAGHCATSPDPHVRAGHHCRSRGSRGAALHRLLHCQHPQPEHARRLCCRGARLLPLAEQRGVTELAAIRTHHVSAYIEALTRSHKPPTVKQHLAAIRMLFDWLIVGQVVGQNPAAAVRGPKHS